MSTTLAKGLAQRFRFASGFLRVLTDGYADDDWRFLPGGEFQNTPHWILAHLVMSRRYTLRVLGVVVEKEPWEELFTPGAEVSDPAGYPPVDELVSAFRSLGEELGAKLEGMSDEELAQPVKRKFPDGGEDLVGAAGFMSFHENYHLGQLGMYRRLLGKPGFA